MWLFTSPRICRMNDQKFGEQQLISYKYLSGWLELERRKIIVIFLIFSCFVFWSVKYTSPKKKLEPVKFWLLFSYISQKCIITALTKKIEWIYKLVYTIRGILKLSTNPRNNSQSFFMCWMLLKDYFLKYGC